MCRSNMNLKLCVFHRGMNLVHKIHGHKDKDEGDPEKPAAKYSKLFKSTFGPLYSTLEGTAFDFSEDESSFVVNNMLQVLLYYYNY